jgi:enoyl-CoA hydratase/carnithine racemase
MSAWARDASTPSGSADTPWPDRWSAPWTVGNARSKYWIAGGRPGLDGDTETLIALESVTCNVAHQSNDAREGVRAFLEKRDPVWTDS